MSYTIKQTIDQVPIGSIVSNRYQPRLGFEEDEIKELAASIREVGLLHPPLVRRIDGSDSFEIISGERRVRACKSLGYETISVLIQTDSDDTHAAKAALIENVQRVDLNPIEIAKAIKILLNEFGYTQEQLAEKIGKKRSTVTNFLRLLQLPKEMQEALSGSAISMAHAKVLLSCPESERKALFTQMLQKNISVRTSEKLVKEYIKSKKSKKDSQIHIRELIESLECYFGTKVNIRSVKNKGEVRIHFYTLDDLERIVELIPHDK
jgi:ParB family chromosome partitioning protein